MTPGIKGLPQAAQPGSGAGVGEWGAGMRGCGFLRFHEKAASERKPAAFFGAITRLAIEAAVTHRFVT